jgi:hypothetical protein
MPSVGARFFARSEPIATPVVSDDALFINGANIVVDGGGSISKQ